MSSTSALRIARSQFLTGTRAQKRFATSSSLCRQCQKLSSQSLLPLGSVQSRPLKNQLPVSQSYLGRNPVAFSTAADKPIAPNWRGKKKKGVRDIGRDDNQPDVVTPAKESLRVTAYCTAESYDFHVLLPLLQRHYLILPFLIDDVYHVRLVDPPADSEPRMGVDPLEGSRPAPEAFIFKDGTLATWGATEAQNAALLKMIKRAEINPYPEAETEWFNYFLDNEQPGGLTAESIIIGNALPHHQARLAYSSGLARSVKLGALEDMLERHLEKTRQIPQVLLQGKKLPLSRAAVLKNLGELYLLRGHLNLHGELLDHPEFCWSNAKMEDIFERMSRNLDVRSRIAVFNKKLDYANELTEVLRSHLHTEHGTRLEWAIIILIMIEVGFQIYHTYKEEFGEGSHRAITNRQRNQVAQQSEFTSDENVEEIAEPKQDARKFGKTAERASINKRADRDRRRDEEDLSEESRHSTSAPVGSSILGRWARS